jgi:hypothetical protein
MSRRCSFDSTDALMRDLIEESENTSGTWSLATHSRLTAFLGESPSDTINCFTLEITKRLINPACSPVQRFKFAQLCTTVRRLSPPACEIFDTFRSELMEVAARAGDPIDIATAKLVNSLYAPLASARPARPQSSTPVSRLIPVRRRVIAVTPPD